jgi:hypothetical protein
LLSSESETAEWKLSSASLSSVRDSVAGDGNETSSDGVPDGVWGVRGKICPHNGQE